MNVNYSKENVILEAVRAILVADTGTLTGEVKSIGSYVGTSIIRKNAFLLPISDATITIEAIQSSGSLGLPSSKWFLVTTAIKPMEDGTSPQVDVSNIAARISILLNKKHIDLNNKVPTKNLRCRYINHLSTHPADDTEAKLYKRDVMFELIVDDEVLTCE